MRHDDGGSLLSRLHAGWHVVPRRAFQTLTRKSHVAALKTGCLNQCCPRQNRERHDASLKQRRKHDRSPPQSSRHGRIAREKYCQQGVTYDLPLHEVWSVLGSNAALQARGAAAATQERRLFPVACKRWLGWGDPVSCGWGAPGLAHSRALAPFYSITSSAKMRSVGGNVIPSACAVLRLRTSSNFMGCSTGRSAGLVPLRRRST